MPTPEEVRAETEAALRAGGDEEELDLSYIDEELMASLSEYAELSDEELDASLRRDLAAEDPKAELRPAEEDEGALASYLGWNVVIQGRTVWYRTATYAWSGNQTRLFCFYSGNVRYFSSISGRVASCPGSTAAVRRIYT